MSGDNTMSCGTCHIHEAGGSDPRIATNPGPDGLFGTDDDISGSAGVVAFDSVGRFFVHEDTFFPDVQVTGRKAPPAINAAHFDNVGMFWDGRATGEFRDPITDEVLIGFGGALESQAVGPPLSDVEMGGLNRNWDDIIDTLELVKPMALATDLPDDMADYLLQFPDYPAMFEDVYGTPEITIERIAFAIANYERTLIANETLLDLDLDGVQALSPEHQAALDLFNGAANCAACHTLPFTSDLNFHNIGIRPESEDIGLEATTMSPFDKGKFKTPNIRNASLRTPLFHNGSADTVDDVIAFYGRGGDFDELGLLDENMQVLLDTEGGVVSQEQLDSLTAFINEALVDPRVVNNEFPFTRPTLRSELQALDPLNDQYGVESLNGVGEAPTMMAHIPANLSNLNFLIGVDNATPFQKAVLAFAFEDDPAGTIFSDPRFPVPVNIQVDTLFLLIDTMTDGFGVATASLPLPLDEAIDGLTIYAQWFIADPDATSTGGVYGSKGVSIPLFLTSASLP